MISPNEEDLGLDLGSDSVARFMNLDSRVRAGLNVHFKESFEVR